MGVNTIEMPKMKYMIKEIEFEDIYNLAIIKILEIPVLEVAQVTVNQIIEIKKQSTSNKVGKAKVRDSINNLLSNRYIRVYRDINMEDEVLDMSNIKYNDTMYICVIKYDKYCLSEIGIKDLLSIISIESNYKANILAMYLKALDYDFDLALIDNHSINVIVEETGIDRRSIEKYIKLFLDARRLSH